MTREPKDAGDVTYSPQDDKIRVYFVTRQSEAVLEPLKAVGFRWAGAQECWHAHWTPAREDAAMAATGAEEIDDESSTLESRAEERSERFAGYHENAAKSSEAARQVAHDCTDCIPPGQPILVGHHSERRHRRALERADSAMRKCIEEGKRADYWKGRAAGSVRWATYKEKPGVRARRIKTLEAEARKVGRTIATYDIVLQHFVSGAPFAKLYAMANDGRLPLYGAWSRLNKAKDMDPLTSHAEVTAIIADVRSSCEHNRANQQRWADHLAGRIAYEHDQLRAQSAEHLVAPKPRDTTRAKLPILNLREGAHEMTAAEYLKIHKDYRGMRVIDNRYRIRTAIVRGSLFTIFLTDQSEDAKPTGNTVGKAEVVE